MIDIGTAWALIAICGMTDPVAVVVGFSLATVTNYFGHQLWTFWDGDRQTSLRRFMAFVGAVALTLAVRLLVLDLLSPLLPGSGLTAPIRLGLAAEASFFASFLISKLVVFDRRFGSSVQ